MARKLTRELHKATKPDSRGEFYCGDCGRWVKGLLVIKLDGEEYKGLGKYGWSPSTWYICPACALETFKLVKSELKEFKRLSTTLKL